MVELLLINNCYYWVVMIKCLKHGVKHVYLT